MPPNTRTRKESWKNREVVTEEERCNDHGIWYDIRYGCLWCLAIDGFRPAIACIQAALIPRWH